MCSPPPPPLTTATVVCICSNLSLSVALSWSVNIRSFSFVLTVEKTPAVPCITGWRLRRWFRWFWPGRRCKSSPLNSTFNDNVAFAKQTEGVGLAIRRSRVRVPLLSLAGFVLGRPEFKSSATLVNSHLVASCQLGFLIQLCCTWIS